MQSLRRALILIHRYLGIPLSLLFVVWFVSGIAMIYVGGMPQLSEEERLEHLPELDLAAVRLTPAEALAAAEIGSPGQVALLPVLGRPAYRFGGRGGATTVFADTGELLDAQDVDAEKAIAARFVGAPLGDVTFVRTVERPDQWTLVMSRALPLEKFAVDDGRGTEVYVSATDAAVALVTTTRTRTLAWVATIPHWFYITPLRVNQPLWYWTVVWASGLGCVLAVLGLVLGVTQFRKSTPFSFSKSIRYTGWMRWHYILGVFFGVFALTWVFSGLLSMEPFDWTNARGLEVRGDAFTGGPLEIERFGAFEAGAWNALRAGRTLKEIELKRIQDEPYYVARYSAAPVDGDAKRERLHQPYDIAGRAQPETHLIDATTLRVQNEPFSVESLLARLRAGAPGAAIVEHELLDRLRRLLLFARPRGAAARAAREVRRSDGDVGLRRPRDERAARRDPSAEPDRALAVQRPPQPRLRLLVRPAPALGHRHDRALRGRARVERDRLLSRSQASAARSIARLAR